ncbi:MAG: hypothetical protein KDA41_11430, partial [Planctomycetales bacterium]|nr:hypothetical protein [Planctomycetales bacterium]
MNRAKISLAIAVVLAAVCPLHAGLIIDIQESGADVVVTTSGTLNTTGLTSSLGLFLPSGNGGLADFGAAPNSSRGLVTRGALVTLLGDPSFSGPAYPFLETNKLFNSSSGDATGLGFTQNFGGQLGVYIPSG